MCSFDPGRNSEIASLTSFVRGGLILFERCYQCRDSFCF
jgi:hypothetical protein